MVFSVLHGVDQRDLMCSWDAAAITSVDAGRLRPPSHQVLTGTDYRKAFHELTGGSLKPHIDIGWGTARDLVQQRMQVESGIDFPFCVQSQFICHSVPVGGAMFFFAPGVMRVWVVVVFGCPLVAPNDNRALLVQVHTPIRVCTTRRTSSTLAIAISVSAPIRGTSTFTGSGYALTTSPGATWCCGCPTQPIVTSWPIMVSVTHSGRWSTSPGSPGCSIATTVH